MHIVVKVLALYLLVVPSPVYMCVVWHLFHHITMSTAQSGHPSLQQTLPGVRNRQVIDCQEKVIYFLTIHVVLYVHDYIVV